MERLAVKLRHEGYNVSAVRSGEVIVVTLPCFTAVSAQLHVAQPQRREQARPARTVCGATRQIQGDCGRALRRHRRRPLCRPPHRRPRNTVDDYFLPRTRRTGFGIIPYGLGGDEPLMPNHGIENRATNRRVEIYFVPTRAFIDKAKPLMDSPIVSKQSKHRSKNSRSARRPAPDGSCLVLSRLRQRYSGALMIEKDATPPCATFSSPNASTSLATCSYTRLSRRLGFEQKSIDMMTVVNQLRQSGTLEQAGGAAFVVGLTSNVASAHTPSSRPHSGSEAPCPRADNLCLRQWRTPLSTKATTSTTFFRGGRKHLFEAISAQREKM